MSRVIIPTNEFAKEKNVECFIIGLDRPLNEWFYQLELSPDAEGNESYLEGDGISGCSRSTLLEMIEKYGDMEDPIAEKAYGRVALDLDPCYEM